ncbi:integrase core domain-containing protein [Mycolicibacterium sp. 120320]|uniref:integrase core domain-containing protein n=1 Tax=unclassified Mycolicibacterium TaxID=2636767 RepID=UPI003FA53755
MLYILPGTPCNNGSIESSNNRLRKECLNRDHRNTLIEARVVIGVNTTTDTASRPCWPPHPTDRTHSNSIGKKRHKR